MKHYVNFWRHYADFKGRTTVAGFFVALAIHTIIVFLPTVLILIILAGVFRMQKEAVLQSFYTFQGLHGVLCLCPLAAITIRRLRDAGYSWHSLFWLLLPGLGMVALLARLCTQSTGSRTEV